MGREEQIKDWKSRRGVAKGKFTRKTKSFTDALVKKAPLIILDGIYKEVIEAFLIVEQLNEEYTELFYDSGNEEDVAEIEEANRYIYDLETIKVSLGIELENHRVNKNVSAKLSSHDTVPSRLTVKKLDPPMFSGNMRDFPSFKEDYNRLVVHNFGEDPYVLRQCLTGEALQTIKGLENDYKAMFERLNYKYGNCRKIVDLIISDLRALKVLTDGDNKGFIKMVETVERCYFDLRKMNLESEMDSTNIMGLVERVMPPLQKREWVAIMDEQMANDGGFCSLDFKRLLDYLLKQKRRIEYMGADIRNHHNTKSYTNNVVGKEEEECNLNTAVNNLQVSQRNMEKQLLDLTKALNTLSSNNNKAKMNDHNLQIKCHFHESNNHDMQDCFQFKSMSDKEKMELVKRKGLCYRCLVGQHLGKNCINRENCTIMVNNKPCGMWHHPLLHRAHVDGIMHHNTSKMINDGAKSKVMLMVSYVYCNGMPVSTLWDSGSDITMITHSLAKKLRLKGKEVIITMTKVGNTTETFKSKQYNVPLTDQEGKVWHIMAYGLEEITSNVHEVDSAELSRLLQIDPTLIVRPVGKLDLLVGSDCCQLLPNVIRTIGNMQLLKNQFGYCIRGNFPMALKDQNCNNIHMTLNHATTVGLHNIEISKITDLKDSLDKVFGNELDMDNQDLTCTCKRKGINDYTLKEKRELDIIEQGLKFDETKGYWVAKYPWLKDPKDLPNNINSAISRMKATEKRLMKLGKEYCDKYQEQIDDMIQREVAVKLTRKEINFCVNPIHYIHHHEVIKSDSTSTPIRIVFDSSATYLGHQLNSYWAKGPDILNSLLGVLLRMRQEKIVIMGDITKMYHSVRLDESDQNTHRFVWRNFNLDQTPEHYKLTRVTFGDKPSGIISTLALRHTAEKYLDEYSNAARMILHNTYVDDMIQSVSSEAEAYEIIKGAEQILSSGGFLVKHWILSGEEHYKDIKLLATESEKALGMAWNVKDDEFFYSVKINFSPKIRKIHIDPDILDNELQTKFPEILTRRMVLSQVASVFDPLGLAEPFTLTAKLLMREMIMENRGIGWDDPIEEKYRRRWLKFFSELYKLENFKVKRVMKPDNAIGNPVLILFSDGSKDAYGAVAYCRFLTSKDIYETSLIMSKSKVTPTKQITIPRIELCAALLSCRMREKIERELDWKFEAVYHLVDSQIVRGQIQKDSHKFKSFVGTRIAEIQCKSKPDQWFWINTDINPADMLTRPVPVDKLQMDSDWKKGPDFLRLNINYWPINQNNDVTLPDMIGLTLTCESNVNKSEDVQINMNIIDIQRFSSYTKLLRVTSRIIAAVNNKSFKMIRNFVESNDMKNAEKYWSREVQKEFLSDWRIRFKCLGPVMNDDKIITVGSRMESWLKHNWNSDTYILLPANHQFTHLYISYVHNLDHAGIETTVAKVQRKFWIPGVRRIVKSVKHKCVLCKIINPKVEDQKMGELVEERLKPSPPFTHTACDLFGPYKIRDTVKRRSFGKAYGIIFNCMCTRAVYLDVIDGCSTNSVLMALRRFLSIRGYPNTLYSDRGTQLVAASREIKLMFNELDWRTIEHFGKTEGMQWTFTKSADAPWQNGVSEALVKSVERSLKATIGDSTFTFSELQTIFFDVGNLLNERPIGLKRGSDINAGCYLCPNELLLGRASNHAPVGLWSNCNMNKRLEFMHIIVTGFWKKWQRDYFPTLLIQQKWHVAKRNVQVGDIVIVQDSNAVRGTWKLAQVVEAQPGRDGLVRDVVIKYKVQKPGSKYQESIDMQVRRSVHRLVVILPVKEQ